MTRTQCCDSNSKFKFTKSFSTLAAEECGRRGRSSGVLSSLALSLLRRSLAARATPRCNYGETRTELSTNWNGVSFFLLRSSFSLSLSVACFQPTTDLSLPLSPRSVVVGSGIRPSHHSSERSERSVVRQVRNEKRTQRRLSFCLSFVMAGRRMGGLWGILTCVVFRSGR